MPSCRWLLALLLLLTNSGCVQRHIDVTSDPSGAFVFLDGQLIGRTPVRVDFHHYGTRELILRHPGIDALPTSNDERSPEFRTVREEVEIEIPWFQHFPLDLVTEHFWPVQLVDTHRFHYRLDRYDPADSAAEFEAAAREAGLFDPAPAAPPAPSTPTSGTPPADRAGGRR